VECVGSPGTQTLLTNYRQHLIAVKYRHHQIKQEERRLLSLPYSMLRASGPLASQRMW